jgi:hypothetical protein
LTFPSVERIPAGSLSEKESDILAYSVASDMESFGFFHISGSSTSPGIARLATIGLAGGHPSGSDIVMVHHNSFEPGYATTFCIEPCEFNTGGFAKFVATVASMTGGNAVVVKAGDTLRAYGFIRSVPGCIAPEGPVDWGGLEEEACATPAEFLDNCAFPTVADAVLSLKVVVGVATDEGYFSTLDQVVRVAPTGRDKGTTGGTAEQIGSSEAAIMAHAAAALASGVLSEVRALGAFALFISFLAGIGPAGADDVLKRVRKLWKGSSGWARVGLRASISAVMNYLSQVNFAAQPRTSAAVLVLIRRIVPIASEKGKKAGFSSAKVVTPIHPSQLVGYWGATTVDSILDGSTDLILLLSGELGSIGDEISSDSEEATDDSGSGTDSDSLPELVMDCEEHDNDTYL